MFFVMAYPMTVIVVILLVGCLAAGVAIVLGAKFFGGPVAGTMVCPKCRAANLAIAKFCSQCGGPFFRNKEA